MVMEQRPTDTALRNWFDCFFHQQLWGLGRTGLGLHKGREEGPG